MIYTSMDMIRDCRAGKPEGWSFLITNFVPPMRLILAHYAKPEPGLLERILQSCHDPHSELFAVKPLTTEREFVTILRGHILRELEAGGGEGAGTPLELDVLTTALEGLTATERQMAWFPSMGYRSAEIAAMMNVEVRTVEGVESRADELLRGHLDRWSKGMIAGAGRALGRMAESAVTEDCLTVRTHLDLIDGRITWQGKQNAEAHLAKCWHCVDHLCRIREADALVRQSKPLTREEAQPFRDLLGLPKQKQPFWKKLAGAR